MTVSQAFPGYDAPARPPCASCGATAGPKRVNGWCNACYGRWLRAGRPEEGPPPPRTRGHDADAAGRREDYAWLRGAGLTREEAADRVGVHRRTADRWPMDEEGLLGTSMAVGGEGPGGWTADAGCRDADPELFFPSAEDRASGRAIAICRACPVVRECLEWALEHCEYGVWGGTTTRQRTAIRAATVTKECAGCGLVKTLGEYGLAASRDGRRARCVECEAAGIEGGGSPGG